MINDDLETPESDNVHWECPFCQTQIPDGFSVCMGCNADVIYGVTRNEWQTIFIGGAILGGTLASGFVLYLPMLLNDLFRLGFRPNWGVDIMYAIAGIIMFSGFSGFFCAKMRDETRRYKPPRFYRR